MYGGAQRGLKGSGVLRRWRRKKIRLPWVFVSVVFAGLLGAGILGLFSAYEPRGFGLVADTTPAQSARVVSSLMCEGWNACNVEPTAFIEGFSKTGEKVEEQLVLGKADVAEVSVPVGFYELSAASPLIMSEEGKIFMASEPVTFEAVAPGEVYYIDIIYHEIEQQEIPHEDLDALSQTSFLDNTVAHEALKRAQVLYHDTEGE